MDEDAIFKNCKELLDNKEAYKEMSRANNLYGDGSASKRIAEILSKIL